MAKAVKALRRSWNPWPQGEESWHKAVVQAGDDVLNDESVKDTMKKVAKQAMKEAVDRREGSQGRDARGTSLRLQTGCPATGVELVEVTKVAQSPHLLDFHVVSVALSESAVPASPPSPPAGLLRSSPRGWRRPRPHRPHGSPGELARLTAADSAIAAFLVDVFWC
jgi:hypothetical protein